MTQTNLTGVEGEFGQRDEQERTHQFIALGTEEFSELQAEFKEAVALLQERRTALISAAVTGKIDVRGWKRPYAASEKETEMDVA